MMNKILTATYKFVITRKALSVFELVNIFRNF